jgi:hypothetical protein
MSLLFEEVRARLIGIYTDMTSQEASNPMAFKDRIGIDLGRSIALEDGTAGAANGVHYFEAQTDIAPTAWPMISPQLSAQSGFAQNSVQCEDFLCRRRFCTKTSTFLG